MKRRLENFTDNIHPCAVAEL